MTPGTRPQWQGHELARQVREGQSGRRSSRVEGARGIPPGQAHAGADSAPEGSVSCLASLLPPASSRRDAAPEGKRPGDGDGESRNRTSRKRLEVVRADLSRRHWAILRSLSDHPYLLTRHLLQLHFRDHATAEAAGRICRRVLARLAERRIIDHLDRRIGGVRAGSASYVWRLGPVGHRLLAEANGDGPTPRRKEPSLHHLDHSLAIADAAVDLTVAGASGFVDHVHLRTEPSCWRSYIGQSGARVFLKPDLEAVVSHGAYDSTYFIEQDQATESLPSLIRKCRQYETYRRTGQEQAARGVFPWVVWVLPTQARLDKLRQALRRSHDLDPLLFRLTTPDALLGMVLVDSSDSPNEGVRDAATTVEEDRG